MTHGTFGAQASSGPEFVRVTAFKLLRRYDDSKFLKVATELKARMEQIAAATHGTIAGTTIVTAAGIRSHSYQVDDGGNVEQYTFVLRDLREYQLLCHRKSSSSNAVCDRLVTTFATA